MNGKSSNWLPVLSGVPQGSILGPLLFILYINDITSVIKSSSLKKFADDVSIYAKVLSVYDCLKAQEDLSCVYEWSVKWQLTLSPHKCEAVNITNKRLPVSFIYHTLLTGHPKLDILASQSRLNSNGRIIVEK